MTTAEFLTENREAVINFYNSQIKGSWNITLKAFMLDLMANFRKATLASIPVFTKTDLSANLLDAKNRLGIFDNKIEVKFDRDAFIAKKYKGTVFANNLAL